MANLMDYTGSTEVFLKDNALFAEGMLDTLKGNYELPITASQQSFTFTAPKTGTYDIILSGGGGGGGWSCSDESSNDEIKAGGGGSGFLTIGEKYMQKGEQFNIVVGKGGIGSTQRGTANTAWGGHDGGDTTFNDTEFVALGGKGGAASRLSATRLTPAPGYQVGGTISDTYGQPGDSGRYLMNSSYSGLNSLLDYNTPFLQGCSGESVCSSADCEAGGGGASILSKGGDAIFLISSSSIEVHKYAENGSKGSGGGAAIIRVSHENAWVTSGNGGDGFCIISPKKI